MWNTLEKDRPFIETKYHGADSADYEFNRFNQLGWSFDNDTGLTREEIDKALGILYDGLNDRPHPVIKSEMFAFVLDNTKIDINEHDWFAGIFSTDRPLMKYTSIKWKNDVYNSKPWARDILTDYENCGASYGGLDFEHTVPDWDSLLSLGFSGVLKRCEKAFYAIEKPSMKQAYLFEGIKTEYEAILRLIDRLYKRAGEEKHEKAPLMARCFKNLRDGAPTNTYEALQLIYLYFILSECVDNYQVRSLGHGLDASLYPFFVNDLKCGKFTKEKIAEFLSYFLLQWSAIGNYWGQPFYLGGTDAKGNTRVNELSYLILDTYRRLGIYNPKIQIKTDDKTPLDFLYKAFDMIREGNSSIVFCNNEIVKKCLMSRGATYEEACDGVISGCYEYKARCKDIGISASYFNLLKPVSWVIDSGYDSVIGKDMGLKTGDISSFLTYDSFLEAYFKQLCHLIDTYHKAINALEEDIGVINPSLMFSATSKMCTNKMTDALDGGLENITLSLISGVGSAVDSLMAVKYLVYDKKLCTFSELKSALDNDWNGYGRLRAKALLCPHKYGNGDKESDELAALITDFIAKHFEGKRNSHGGRFSLEMHSARAFVIHGEKTKATPDGRKSGEETSKNASPSPGMDKCGVTALINSATTIDSSLCNEGFCLDVMLHPSAVSGSEGNDVLKAVTQTYFNKGGASIHFNIFDAETLKEAQQNPERYKNLQVRVCGWNTLWSNMDKKEQDAYILRAENIQ